MIYNVVLVSGISKVSVIHKHVFIIFQILFSYKLSQNV